MSVRLYASLALCLSVSMTVCSSGFAGDKGKGGKDGKHDPIAVILKHGEELKLTAEQKVKLEALEAGLKAKKGEGKGDKKEKGKKGGGKSDGLKEKLKDILTAEQLEKIKSYLGDGKEKKDKKK